jgi:SecD/SecF fusion protein
LKRHLLVFLAVLALTAAAVWYDLSPRFPIALGLDLRGGMRVTLQPDYAKLGGKGIDAETMELVRAVLENRVNSFGLSGTEVRLKGSDQVLILLPGAGEPREALRALVTVAQLEFRHLLHVQTDRNPAARYRMDFTPGDAEKGEPDRYRFHDTRTDRPASTAEVLQSAELILKGDALRPTSRGDIDPNKGEPYVSFELNSAGTRAFGDFTSENVGEILAVVLDGEIISAPRIDEPITGGEGQISGGFRTMLEARVLANLLNSGALPIPLTPAETQTVGATLGQASIDRSLRAGLAGLGIVLLFMLVYYWLPGLVACAALLAYAALTFALFKGLGLFPPIVLDLPGITGFILSIGMAVDGNVLIFERMKEELREGRSLDRALEAGFRRAFAAIVDSNVTVWIICAVLAWLGTPMVKGFAITLALGNAVAMFTAITVTRACLRVLTEMSWARSPALYAVHNSWLNLFFPAWRSGRVMRVWDQRRRYFGLSLALAAASLLLVALTPLGRGLQPGIDFTGGSVIEAAFRDPDVNQGEIAAALRSAGVPDATVRLGHAQPAGDGSGSTAVAEITAQQLPPDRLEAVRSALSKIGGGTVERLSRVTSIGPSIAAEVTRNGAFAAIAASLAMLLFLAVRFAIGGLANGLKFGLGAVVALFHDVLLTVGLFALMGQVAGWKVDSLFLTACLGLLGFSVNDTIVIYDRVRENLARRRPRETLAEVADRSMTESFDRSVNTSFAVMLALLAMVLFGGETLRLFNLALLFGMAVGTYSSVFVATPLVVLLAGTEGGTRSPNAEDAVRTEPPAEEQPFPAVRPGVAAPQSGGVGSAARELSDGRIRPRRHRRP